LEDYYLNKNIISEIKGEDKKYKYIKDKYVKEEDKDIIENKIKKTNQNSIENKNIKEEKDLSKNDFLQYLPIFNLILIIFLFFIYINKKKN
jgi:hypothetical protein